MNGLGKNTHFFQITISITSIMVCINKFLTAEHLLIIAFLKQTLYRTFYKSVQPTCGTIPKNNLSFSWTSGCISYIRVLVGCLITSKNFRECQLLRLFPRKAYFTGRNCQKCKGAWLVLIIRFNSIPIKRLEFLHQGLTQRTCNCETSFNFNFSMNTSVIASVLDKCWKV